MDSRRSPLLSSVAVIVLLTAAARSDAGWLSGRDGRFHPFHHDHSCTPLCQPPSCVVANPCECLPLFLPTPWPRPALSRLVPEVLPASPLRLSGGAWNMSPTGHATSFLDTGRAFRVQLPPFSTSPPLYVLPPGGRLRPSRRHTSERRISSLRWTAACINPVALLADHPAWR